MRARRLSTLCLSAALAATVAMPSIAAAGPQVVERTSTGKSAPAPAQVAPADDDAQYAAREKAADPAVAEFQGGAAYIAIGGTALGVILLVVLLVVLL